jgi:hypothetical protein
MFGRKSEIKIVLSDELVKHLASFETDRDFSFFVPFTFNGDEQVVQIYCRFLQRDKFVNPATSINRKAKHGVEPMLMKRSRLKRK